MTMNRIVTLPSLPPRPEDGHKGTFGRVLVVGGQEGMLGAPVLAGSAALRTGSGLVQIAIAKNLLGQALSITPELIGLPLGAGGDTKLLDSAKLADAIVVGPGMGTSAGAKSRLLKLIKLDRPMVIDADGLNLLALQNRWSAMKARAILTPHPGEMRRLVKLLKISSVPDDTAGRIDLACRASKAFGQIVVLKGHQTVVTDGTRVYVNRTGESSLAKAGSGDVLSGIIGSLLGQSMDRFDAAIAGVWIHGKAGELAGAALGKRSTIARDVIDRIGDAIAAYESQVG
jgi:NAD(P)H-hydrate epimerase